jgi:hypothetical protein
MKRSAIHSPIPIKMIMSKTATMLFFKLKKLITLGMIALVLGVVVFVMGFDLYLVEKVMLR